MIGKSKIHGPGTYTIVWDSDPALVPLDVPEPPADDADADTIKAYEKKIAAAVEERFDALRVARENQDWTALLKPGEQPTRFVCQWIGADVRAAWLDASRDAKIGDARSWCELLLCALVAIDGVKVPRGPHPDQSLVWDRADPACFDAFRGAIGPLGVTRLISALAREVASMEARTGPL